MTDHDKKLIRNSTTAFLIFTVKPVSKASKRVTKTKQSG
jgi:hypothetical protein